MAQGKGVSSYATKLLSRYKYYFLLVIILACLNAGLNTSFGALLKWVADGLGDGRSDVLFYFIVLFSLQRFLLPITGASGTLISNRFANKIESDIRKSWYEYIVGMDYGSASLRNSGESQKKIQEAVISVRSLLNNTIRSVLSIVLEIASITLFGIWLVGWGAGLVLLFFAAFYSAFVIYVTRKRVPLIREIAQSDSECAAFMHDSFINSGAITPSIRDSRKKQHEILLVRLEKSKNHNARKLFLDSSISSIICLAICFLTLMAYYWKGGGSAGTVIMLATGLAQLIAQINTLGFNYRSILSAKVDVIRISEGLKVDQGVSIPLVSPVFGAGQYEFSFQGFRALGIKREEMLPIHGVINISSGLVNTLHGTSGIGKSTIARAMRGEIGVSPRQLLVNNTDVSGMNSDLLKERINHISQDNTIFNESIVRNLRYGKPDATIREVEDSLARVGLQKFSDNVEFVVGEKGGRLSGGERQRLIIARGLLQDCEILILDEPFSGLDEETAINLASTITNLAIDTCIFVIMHQSAETVFGLNSLGNQYVMMENNGNIIIECRR